MHWVEFDALPEFFPPLFRRWLREPAAGRHGVVLRPEDVPEPQPGASWDVRGELCARLEEYQRALGAPPEALQSLEKLRDRRACAVLTGQQSHLLGGPLLVTYKAVTAVALARRLERQWGRPVVPVFWNHSDDADVDEIRRVHLIDRDNRLRTLEVDDAVPTRAEIASLRWTESLPRLLAACRELLPAARTASEIGLLLDAGVTQGPAAWFGCFLTRMLGPLGLVLFEPRLGRRLWADTIERGVREMRRGQEVLAAEERALAAEGFDPPLRAESVATVFRVVDGRRRKLRWVEGGRLQEDGLQESRSVEETARLVREAPDSFSPGVALRPVCQDRVFPTAACVGGPAEIGYLTQLRPLYAAFDLHPPTLVPRLSATLIEPKIRKVIDKFRLPPAEVLHLGRTLPSLIEASLPTEVIARYHQVRHDLVLELRVLRDLTEGIDPGLERHYRRFAGKVMRGLKELKHRTADATLARQEVGRSQLEKAVLHLTPRSQLQERTLTAAHYLCLFGPGLVDTFLAAADQFAGRHVLLDLS